jgi:hypothetical protein
MADDNPRVRLLLAMLDDAYDKSDEHSLTSALRKITREELHYRPVPETRGVGKSFSGPGTTTIALRLVHVALCKVMYENHAFGDPSLDWEKARKAVALPHPVDEPGPLIASLDAAQERLRAALLGLADADLDTMVYTNWGEQWPAWRIFNSMIQHDIWHGGQIRTLRKLWELERKRSARGT